MGYDVRVAWKIRIGVSKELADNGGNQFHSNATNLPSGYTMSDPKKTISADTAARTSNLIYVSTEAHFIGVQ
jgi:hypothetical protein